MRAKEVRKQRARVAKLAERWKTNLGLGKWDIDHEFKDAGLDGEGVESGWQWTAETDARWPYQMAQIRWSLPSVADMDDKDLERTVVHELLHCLTCEMQRFAEGKGRMDRGQTERTVVDLTLAVQWAYAAGERAGRKAAKA